MFILYCIGAYSWTDAIVNLEQGLQLRFLPFVMFLLMSLEILFALAAYILTVQNFKHEMENNEPQSQNLI